MSHISDDQLIGNALGKLLPTARHTEVLHVSVKTISGRESYTCAGANEQLMPMYIKPLGKSC